MRAAGFALCTATWLLVACSFEDQQKHCSRDAQCSAGEVCYDGFCIAARKSAGQGGSDTETPAANGGNGGREPASGGKPGTGTINNPATANAGRPAATPSAGKPAAGSGGAGMSATSPPPAGSPAQPCKAGEMRSCTLPSASAEQCRMGTQRCDNGQFGACVGNPSSVAEVCNGIDDDCDGVVDEAAADVVCYPSDVEGCTIASGQAPQCKGMCAAGKRLCRNGTLQPCSGEVRPAQEVCTPAGAAAADENCNGQSDEVCACMAGETHSCYPAPSNTINVGTCRAGMQSCTNGMLGGCTGAVTPQTETCLNESADDDCNGTADDIAGRGMPCSVESNAGLCRMGVLQCTSGRAELTCITPQPAPAESCNGLDDDCDTKTDEGFDFMTDPMHCGNCATACAQGESCCAGKCTNFNTDAANCGGCGTTHACAAGSSCCGGMCLNTMSDNNHCGSCTKACTTDEACCTGSCVNTKTDVQHCGGCNACPAGAAQPGCCSGQCVDLLDSQNCGRCGNRCGVVPDAGVTCTCGTTASGTMCIAPVLGVCI